MMSTPGCVGSSVLCTSIDPARRFGAAPRVPDAVAPDDDVTAPDAGAPDEGGDGMGGIERGTPIGGGTTGVCTVGEDAGT